MSTESDIQQDERLLSPEDTLPKASNLIPNASYITNPDGFRFFNFNGFKIPIYANNNVSLFDHFAQRRNHNQPNLIVVTGNPGSGKTYFGMRASEIYDRHFKVLETDEEDSPTRSNVVFSREHLQFLIDNDSPLKRGACIVIDESQLVIGSRHWMEGVQKDLVEKMEAIRSRGYMIFLIILHRSMLDSQMRNFVITHQIHLERPGLATVYQLNNNRFSSGEVHQRRLGQMHLSIPFMESCAHPDCLNCPYLVPTDKAKQCQNPRALYEQDKRRFIGHYRSLKNKLPKKRELPVDYTKVDFGKSSKEMPLATPEPTEFDDLAQKLFEHQDQINWDRENGVVDIQSAIAVLWQHYNIHRTRGDIAKAITIFKRMLKK